MDEKIRVGIVFGGQSREREISFAGGRTVYDNLNKSLFEPVPLFVDSFGNFVELDWQYIYKGTIRDFYPPVEFLPQDTSFQLYAENLGELDKKQQLALISKIGKHRSIEEIRERVDFIFLCLHGSFGEDGRIQGLLEYHGIPYSGSGILPSSIGINKVLQKELMVNKGFNSPPYIAINRADWIAGRAKDAIGKVKKHIGFPCVVKPANQGSSIGVTILPDDDEFTFMAAVEKALFTKWMDAAEWQNLSPERKIGEIRSLSDIREGMGLPVTITYPSEFANTTLYSPSELLAFLDRNLQKDGFVLEARDAESTVLIEGFIEGKEFSCIVIEDENGKAIALPPTEIRKGKELFDYRSKYLPGLSRKITPIDLPDEKIQEIRQECEELFYELHFDVYARIDGFLAKDGRIFLNDPNTTSGMMPSSFFFHQAAEIGLNPSQFLTYIIRTSMACRSRSTPGDRRLAELLARTDRRIAEDNNALSNKTRVAVILGGYSSERHISVESGRNVFEKLASSEKYAPFPVFLTGDANTQRMFHVPVNLLLKDNADDIREKVLHYKPHPVIEQIRQDCAAITSKYAGAGHISSPEQVGFDTLKEKADEVFIALHGRPGEDGAIQKQLEAVGLPYNGSGTGSSEITIDKYRTNEILKQHGFLVASHLLVHRRDWEKDRKKIREQIEKEISYPFIAKPVDDGCSSAVKKIRSFEEFEAFARLMFRDTDDLDTEAASKLQIKPKEEFPCKNVILVEELISKKEAVHFLEITGGMVTRHKKNGEVEYEVFEASEALAGGEVLSLEEKFLAGEGQNITPARYARDAKKRQRISNEVKQTLGGAAKALGVTGYCRIDAFVRVFKDGKVEVIFIEVNSLPGMTPATCIFHQAAISNYKPVEFIDAILEFGRQRVPALR